jgi:hypothetical protein
MDTPFTLIIVLLLLVIVVGVIIYMLWLPRWKQPVQPPYPQANPSANPPAPPPAAPTGLPAGWMADPEHQGPGPAVKPTPPGVTPDQTTIPVQPVHPDSVSPPPLQHHQPTGRWGSWSWPSWGRRNAGTPRRSLGSSPGFRNWWNTTKAKWPRRR